MPEILQFGFMNRALLAGAVVALICPAIGLFLVLRRLSFIGDALAHVCLAGLAVGMATRFYPVATALLCALAAGVGIERLREAFRRYGELAVSITLACATALAAVLISMGRSFGPDLFAYLFGSILTITRADVLVVAAVGAGVLLLLGALYKELFLITFDEELACAGGLPIRALNTVFMVLASVTVAVAMRVVGALLVSSLLVLPVAASLQVARTLRGALVLAVLFAQTAVLIGLLAAYYLDLASGGTVVLTAVALLLGVLGVKRLLRAGMAGSIR